MGGKELGTREGPEDRVAYNEEEQVCRRPGGRQREHGATITGDRLFSPLVPVYKSGLDNRD
jgi:hypothetical protein